MSALTAPWVKETSASTGTSSLTLTGQVAKYIRFNMGFEAGSKVWYSIEDSNGNREAGIGTFNGTNQLTRDIISATLVSGAFNNSNPAPINLSGNSTVSCTFNSEAYKELVQEINESKYATSTGIFYGGAITINPIDNTKFDISAGKGAILDTSIPSAPLIKEVEWNKIENVSVTNIASQASTLIALNSLGQVIQSPNRFSNAQLRSLIILGGISHPNNTTLDSAYGFKIPSYNVAASLRELGRALGQINESGNVFSANGANLLINRSSGSVFAYGQNFDNNPNNPNQVVTADSLGQDFLLVHGNNAGSLVVTAQTNLVDPNNYDNEGVLTPVGSNRWTNIALYVYPNTGTNVVRYGSATYGAKADALNAIYTEAVESLVELDTGVLRGWLTVKNGTTDLSNGADAVFTVNSGKATGGGSGTPSTGLVAVVDDNNPQLGGDLDTNGFNILLDVGKTVDGRDVSEDGAKLDTIESNATADQNASEVPFTSGGALTSNNVGSALDELESKTVTNAQSIIAANNAISSNSQDISDASVAIGLNTQEIINANAAIAANTQGLADVNTLVQPASTEARGTVEKATLDEAKNGSAEKYPDAAGVHAAFNQFGLGTLNVPNVDDLNTVYPSGIYGFSSGALNRPNFTNGLCIYGNADTNGRTTQIAISTVGGTHQFAYRTLINGTESWIYMYDTSNFVPVTNLTSTSTTTPLAANQGKILYDALAAKLGRNDIGLGNAFGASDIPTQNINTMGAAIAAIYRTTGGVAGMPVFSGHGNVIHLKRSGSGTPEELDGSQVVINKGSTTVGQILAFRSAYDVDSSTVPFNITYHSDNFLYAQNLSGATVSKDGTVSGSSINPAKTGTWRNVSNVDCAVNEKTLFERVGAIV